MDVENKPTYVSVNAIYSQEPRVYMIFGVLVQVGCGSRVVINF